MFGFDAGYLEPEMSAIGMSMADRGRRAAAARAGRDFAELSITVTPVETLTPELVGRYGELGVHRLVVALSDNFEGSAGAALSAMEDFVRRNAPERLGVIV